MGVLLRTAPHVIAQLPGVTRFHSSGDWMHTADLGHTQHLVGGVLYELLHDGPFPGPRHDRLKALWQMIRAEYDQTASPCRLTNLTAEMFEQRDEFCIAVCQGS